MKQNTGNFPLNNIYGTLPIERLSGFHLSLGKKHNIYRKKLKSNIVQRYHIDIFPLVSEIYIDNELVFDSENHYAVK